MDHPVASSQRLLGSGDLMVDQLIAASAAAQVVRGGGEGKERCLQAFDFSSTPAPPTTVKAPVKPVKKCVLPR